MDLLAVERVAGALGHRLLGRLFAGEGDQGLAAALAAEVVQNEDGVGLELRRRQADGQRARFVHQGEPASPRGKQQTADQENVKSDRSRRAQIETAPRALVSPHAATGRIRMLPSTNGFCWTCRYEAMQRACWD